MCVNLKAQHPEGQGNSFSLSTENCFAMHTDFKTVEINVEIKKKKNAAQRNQLHKSKQGEEIAKEYEQRTRS